MKLIAKDIAKDIAKTTANYLAKQSAKHHSRSLRIAKPLVILALGVLTNVIMTTPAHAVIHRPGTFVPTECGQQSFHGGPVHLVAIEQICVGRIVVNQAQQSMPGVQFTMTTGRHYVFRVTRLKLIGPAPNTQGFYYYAEMVSPQGERTVAKLIRTEDGKTRQISGRLATIAFLVTEFQGVFSTTDVLDGYSAARKSYEEQPEGEQDEQVDQIDQINQVDQGDLAEEYYGDEASAEDVPFDEERVFSVDGPTDQEGATFSR